MNRDRWSGQPREAIDENGADLCARRNSRAFGGGTSGKGWRQRPVGAGVESGKTYVAVGDKWQMLRRFLLAGGINTRRFKTVLSRFTT